MDQTARMGAPRGLGRPNCSGFLLLAESLLPGKAVSKLFEPLFVVLDALLVAFIRSSFFDYVFLSPLGASWGRCWAPKLTLQPSKMYILVLESLQF